jgi:hypothetical protein
MAAYYDPSIYTQEELEAELSKWKAEQAKALTSHSADGVSVQRVTSAEIADRLRAITAALRVHDPESYGPARTSCIKFSF